MVPHGKGLMCKIEGLEINGIWENGQLIKELFESYLNPEEKDN